MASRQRRKSYNENLCTFSIKTVQVNSTLKKPGLYFPATVKEVHCTGTNSIRKKTCGKTSDNLCVDEPRSIDVYKYKVDDKGNYIFVNSDDIVINVGCSCHKVYN